LVRCDRVQIILPIASGETAWGAFLRSVPYQYIWGPPVVVLAVLVALVVLRLRSP
jgi:hypothetical protein